MSYKPYFTEWEDSRKMKYLHALITMSLVLIFMWLTTFPDEAVRASLYSIMLVWAGITAAIDAQWEYHFLFAWGGWGDQKRAIPAGIAGAIIMFVIFYTKTLSLSAPLMTALPPAALSFMYVVIAAPYIEEKFFRGMVLFTSIQVFNGNGIPYADLFGVFFNAVIFAVFHGFAYNWEMPGLIAAFVFSLLACIGNQYFKSGAFSFGAHLTNNLLVFMR